MDDSISRQAAIRWVKTECNPYGKPTLDFESGKKVIEHLKQMPSAQPEIVRCRECKFASGNSRICMKFGYGPIGELDFCAWGERKDNDE